MGTITVSYLGELHCEATHDSGSVLVTDAPKDNHGRGEAFSPTDLLATAYATCVLTIMAITAARLEIELAGATAHVEKIMSSDTPRRIVALPLTLAFPVAPSKENRRKLEQAAFSCPVHHSLHPAIEKPIEFVWGTTES